MNVIYAKIWHELWHNKGRTAQIVTIIAMGAFALGMILGSSRLIRQGMTELWQQANPAMINLAVNPTVDDDIIQSLESMRGVAGVEGFSTTNVEWRAGPDAAWQPAELMMRDDYGEQQYTTFTLQNGDWPKDDVLAIGQGAGEAFGIWPGQQIYLRIDDKVQQITIGGEIYNPIANPPRFGGSPQFYTTRTHYGDLTGSQEFNRLLAAAPEFDEEAVSNLADEMQERLEKLDIESSGVFLGRVSNPDEHFNQALLDGIFLVLGILAVVALLLGLLLVYNTMNAVLAQQVDQIGVMKAVGARTNQIGAIYLLLVLIYGILAVIIAVPLGLLGANALSNFLINSFSAEPAPFTIVPEAVLAQVAIALLAPLLASLPPILSGTRITVREAISTYGLTTEAGLLSRWLAKMQFLSRLVVLTLNNTFRHKWRVILTQMILIGSGLIFMMIMSVGDSVAYTYDNLLFSILKFNVSLQFEEPERIQQVERLTLEQPNVQAVEMWGLNGATIRPAGQPESNDDESALLFGVPLPTRLYGPQLRAGRWLEPGDSEAVVLNQQLAEDAGVGVGDWVTLDFGMHGQSEWQVVGLLFDPIMTNSIHVSREALLRQTNSVNEASTVWVQTAGNDPALEAAVADGLRGYFDQRQLTLNPQGTFGRDTASQITDQILSNFSLIVNLLAAMAMVIGLVGAIALSGILSLNVLERRREIGVMRAIGASSRTVAGLLVGEGLTLGWLSWLIALPLSIPAGTLMTQALAQALDGEIVYRYTLTGAWYWLGVVTFLAIVASWLPARGATRISVRESLVYT